jgi:hypothetical protein
MSSALKNLSKAKKSFMAELRFRNPSAPENYVQIIADECFPYIADFKAFL